MGYGLQNGTVVIPGYSHLRAWLITRSTHNIHNDPNTIANTHVHASDVLAPINPIVIGVGDIHHCFGIDYQTLTILSIGWNGITFRVTMAYFSSFMRGLS